METSTKRAAVLAFDLGASSGRALVGELVETPGEGGGRQLRVTELHRFGNRAIHVGDHLHWDTLRLLYEMKQGIRKAVKEGYAPQSLGIDTWGVDFGLLDANGELLGNPYHYRDPQTDGLIEEVVALIGHEALYRQSGLQLMPFNTIFQLYAMRKAASPKLDIAKTLLLTPDLLAYLLTGVAACEFTMATTTQLLHPESQTWNTELMEKLGIPSHLFLEPIQPGTEVGALTPAVCEELDVPPLKVIAVGTHDTESAVAAVPSAEDSFAYLVCGTWSLLGTELPGPELSAAAMEADFSNEGGVGGTYQLLKNIMGLWILQECKSEWEERDGAEIPYAQLVADAEAAEPFRSLIDPDDARFYSPGGMSDKVRAYCAETGQPEPRTPGELTRCILESLAMRYRQALELAERVTGRSFDKLHMVGGGIQNRLLCRMTAGALARPVVAGPVEASAIGNMLLQLVALGYCADLKEARRLVADSFPVDVFEPAAADAAAWSEFYARFVALTNNRA